MGGVIVTHQLQDIPVAADTHGREMTVLEVTKESFLPFLPVRAMMIRNTTQPKMKTREAIFLKAQMMLQYYLL